jgi:hypothetical protein
MMEIILERQSEFIGTHMTRIERAQREFTEKRHPVLTDRETPDSLMSDELELCISELKQFRSGSPESQAERFAASAKHKFGDIHGAMFELIQHLDRFNGCIGAMKREAVRTDERPTGWGTRSHIQEYQHRFESIKARAAKPGHYPVSLYGKFA